LFGEKNYIWAKVTQVSDVAHGPLFVMLEGSLSGNKILPKSWGAVKNSDIEIEDNK
jgi:hypothetical protein